MSIRRYVGLCLGVLLLLAAPSLAETVSFVDANGSAVSTYLEGTQVHVRVEDPAANSQSWSAETVYAYLSTGLSGDSESLTLTETGQDTGVFEGSMALDFIWEGAYQAGVLETTLQAGPPVVRDTLTAQYNSVSDTAGMAAGRIELLDDLGRPAAGYTQGDLVRVRLEDHLSYNDPGTRDSRAVAVNVLAVSDEEFISLLETGNDTGIFEGSIPAALYATYDNDGVVGAPAGNQVHAQHSVGTLDEWLDVYAPLVGSRAEILDRAGNPADFVPESAPIRLRVVDRTIGSPTMADTVQAGVSSLLGADQETVTLTETGSETGVYQTDFPTRFNIVEPTVLGNGRLETGEDAGPPHSFDTITLSYNGLAGASSDTATTYGSETFFIDEWGNDAEIFATGATVFVRVIDYNYDQSAALDSISAAVSGLTRGDNEYVNLVETGSHTGVFEGSLPIQYQFYSVTSYDGWLQAESGETIEARHTDALGSTASADRAVIRYSDIHFFDAQGRPTNELVEGGLASIRFYNFGANYSTYSVDTTTVRVRSLLGGDMEFVTVTETGTNTGIFEGTIRLVFSPVASGGNGMLEVANGGAPDYAQDTVTADASDAVATAATVGARVRLIDRFGRDAESFAAGDLVGIRVEDHNVDDPQARQTLQAVAVVNPETGDAEGVNVTETGYATGIFEGTIPSWLLPYVTANDGYLQVQAGDRLEGRHVWMHSPRIAVDSAVFTGSSVLFVDAQGQPVESYLEATQVYVRLVYAGGNVAPSADGVPVTLSTAISLDSETLILTETGGNTGVFTGSIPIGNPGFVTPTPGNQVLETGRRTGPTELDTLTVTHVWSGGSASDTASMINSRTWFVDAAGNPTDEYARDTRAYIRVEDHILDSSPTSYDVAQVTLRSLNTGDQETFYLQETGPHTGVFAGSMELDAVINGTTYAYPGDGKLQSDAGEEIEVLHEEWGVVASSSDRARIEYASVEFVDQAGQATVELLEGGVARLRVFEPYNSYGSTLGVYVQSRYGDDEEPVTLTETAYQSRVYEGTIQLRSVAPGGGSYNGILETSTSGAPEYRSDEVTASYGGDQALAFTVPSRVTFIDAFGRAASSFAVSERAGVRVEDHNLDNPLTRGTVTVNVTASSGDAESVVLTETGYDTNLFEGSVVLSSGGLTVQAGDVIRAQHGNLTRPTPTTAEATVTGSRIQFEDEAGQPADVYLEGSEVWVRVVDSSAAGSISVTATLRTALGPDVETVVLAEASPGVFLGSMALGTGTAQVNNSVLTTVQSAGPPHQFDTLEVRYNADLGVMDTAATVSSRTWFVDAAGNPADKYARDSRAWVRVLDHVADNPGVYDAVQVTLRSLTTGDQETLYIQETARSGGLFAGSIELDSVINGTTFPNPGDGKLQSEAGEDIEVVRTDWAGYSSSSDRARITYASVVFVDEAGEVTLELLEGGVARLRVFEPYNSYGGGSLGVYVQSRYGDDEEPVTLTETAYQSRVYEGTIQLRSVASGSASSSNGVLETSTSGSPEYRADEVTANYGGDQAVALTVPSRVMFVDGFGRVVSSFGVGEAVGVRVVDNNLDDPVVRRSVMVNVRSLAGDSENVTLTETGYDTNVYEGSIASQSGGIGGGASGNGALQVQAGDVIEAEHGNMTTPNPTVAQATVTGASVLFVDANGQPAETYFEASAAYVRVTDITASGSVTVTVQALLAGDNESVTLTQTGPSVFEGSVPLRIWPSVEPNSGFIETRQDAGPPHEYDTLRVIYQSSAGAVTDTAGTVNSRAWFVDAAGNPTDKYARESRAYVRVENHINDQPGVYDAIQVTLRSLSTGDQETLYIQETARSGGLFAGSIELDAVINGTTFPIPGDGKLQAEAGEDIEVVHDDMGFGTTSSDRARITYASVVFVDEAGEVTLELLEGGVARLRVFEPYNSYGGGSVGVYVQSRYGDDEEPVTLTETAYQSRVYEGTIQLRSVAPGSAVSSNGTLETSTSGSPEYRADEVSASYGGDQALALTVPSRVMFVDGFGQVVSSFGVGEAVGVRVVDNNLDDPVVRRSVMVNVRSLAGDSENLTLTETGYDTNVYEGSIATQTGTPASGNGALQVQAGQVIEAEHGNMTTPNPTVAQATVTGASVLFVDANGQPAETYFEASAAYVRVTDITASGSVTVTVQALLAGDSESVTLTQTGPSVFEGSVPLRMWPSVEPNSGFIETRQDAGPPHEYDTLRVIYQSSAGAVTDTAGTINSRTWFVDAAGSPTDRYARDSRAYVRVESHIDDQPGVYDAIQVTLRSLTTGDQETLYIQETARSGGLFAGSIEIDTVINGTTSPIPGDGKLQAEAGEDIEVVHANWPGAPTSSDRARITYASVVFVDEAGEVTLELLEGGVARLRVFEPYNSYGGGSVGVYVQSRYGDDEEPVTLTETAYQSRVYEGTIQLRSVAPGSAVSSNGTLETSTSGSPEYRADEVSAYYGGDQALALTVPSRVVFVDGFGQVVSSFGVGEAVGVRVVDNNLDDPVVRRSVMVNVRSLAGDSENLTLTETGYDTNVYEGSIATQTGTPASGNGALQVQAGQVIEAEHGNMTTPNPTVAQATVTGASVLFVDANGQPAETYFEASAAYVRVTDITASGSVAVTVQALLAGDSESVTLTQTGPSVFEGSVPLRMWPSVEPNSGFIETRQDAGPPHEYDTLRVIYQSSAGAVTDTAGTLNSRTWFVDAAGNPADGYARGSRAYVRVQDHTLDQPGVQNTAQVTLRSLTTGDLETLTLLELSDGLFEGSLALETSIFGQTYPSHGDGKLQSVAAEEIEVVHDDMGFGTTSSDRATVLFASVEFVDPVGVVTAELLEGGLARLRVFDIDNNYNGGTVGVWVQSLYGDDEEPVTLTETAYQSHIYEGTVQLRSVAPGGGVSSNNLLETSTSGSPEYLADRISAFYSGSEAVAFTVPSRAWFLDLQGQVVTEYAVGSAVRVRVEDHNAGSAGQVDSVMVNLATPGDSESVTLTESGADTGIYEGSIASGSNAAGVLAAAPGVTVTAEHGNLTTPNPTRAQAVFSGNFAPLAVNDSAQTEEAPVTVFVLANDSDPDAESLQVASVTQGANGTVAIDGQTVIYTPTAGFVGTDTFTYVASDPRGGQSRATVTVTVLSANEPPTPAADNVSTPEDTPVTIAVLANDTDPDNDPLEVIGSGFPSNGTAERQPDGTIFYTPENNWSGQTSFTYMVRDPEGLTAYATVTVTVTPVNDPPVANDDEVTVEEDGSSFVHVTDNDNDIDNDTLLVTAVTQGANGVVALNAYGEVTYTPNANFNGTDSFNYTLSDGNGGTDTATVTVTVTPANDAPVGEDDTATTDEDTPVTINVLANDSDPDGDVLDVTYTTGVVGYAVVNADNTITFTPAQDASGTVTFSYAYTDGTVTGYADVTVTINAVNDDPVAVDDSTEVAEDSSATVWVLTNDSDAEGGTLDVTAVTQGANGAVVLNGDDTVTYTPNANFNGSDSFTYTLSDGNGGTDTATVAVNVVAANDAPVADDDTATTSEDAPVTVSVLANDSDPDNDTLTVSAVTQGTNGSVAIVGGIGGSQVTYTPNANFHGTDSFTYTADDGTGGGGGTDTATVTMTVNPVNDAPVANDDAATVAEDSSVSVTVLGNDSDADGDTLDVTAVTQGANGAVVLNADETATYTPNANFHGSDSFTYTVADGNGGADTATVSVTVTSANDAPVANDDTAATPEDTPVTVSVLANDSDLDGDTLTVSAVTQGTNGTVAILGSSQVTYTPNANFHGTDSFTYTANDGNGGTDTATVTVAINPTNDAPVAADDTASVVEDDQVAVAVLGNDSDVDGDSLTITAVTQGTNGAVAITGSTVTYTPAPNFNGTDAFTYTISDGNGGTDTATVSMTVTASNDALTAVDDTATVAEDGSVTVAVLANDTDPENDPLTVVSVTQGTNGAVAIVSNQVTYTPNADFNGTDSFTYTASDGNGGTGGATVTVTVTPVNDAPVAGDDTAAVVEDGSVTISVLGDDTDVDGDTLVVTAVTQGTNGSVAIVGSSQVTYTPNTDFHGTDSFTYSVSDGNGGTDTANVTVTVGAANDAPVANNDSASTAEDTPVTVNVLANDTDLDGDTLSVASVTQGANGGVAISGTQVVYTPGADFHGSDSFTYTASDGTGGGGGSATATVTVTITPVNDAPVAVADSAAVAEDGSVSVSVLANDTDVDGDSLTLIAVTQGAHGSVVIGGSNGSQAVYTPAANYNGPDSFTYTVRDGNGGNAVGTVTVTVTGTNDAPVAVNDSASVAEDGSVVISVRSNDTDLDGDTLTITAVTQGANGSVTHNGSTVTYTPNANYNGSDSFSYTVSDGNGGTATASVAVTVTPVNDAPVAVNDTATTLAEVAVTVNVRANDSDIDSPTLTVTAVTQGAHGSVSITSETGVTYTPAAGWVGPDSFTYTISDGSGGSATATVSVTVQAPARVTGNLQVLYTFYEGSGTLVHDVSGVGTPYNLTIGSASAVTWLPGALSLNSAVLVQNTANATKVINACKSSNEVTMEAWVAPDNTTQTGPAAIASIAQNTTKRNVTLGQSGTAYSGQLKTSTTGNDGTLTSTGAVATTGLTHVVYTRSSTGAVRIYVNGTQVASATLTGNLSGWSNYSLALGGEPNGARYWVGDMHLVAIYSRALTAAEARQNWLAGAN